MDPPSTTIARGLSPDGTDVVIIVIISVRPFRNFGGKQQIGLTRYMTRRSTSIPFDPSSLGPSVRNFIFVAGGRMSECTSRRHIRSVAQTTITTHRVKCNVSFGRRRQYPGYNDITTHNALTDTHLGYRLLPWWPALSLCVLSVIKAGRVVAPPPHDVPPPPPHDIPPPARRQPATTPPWSPAARQYILCWPPPPPPPSPSCCCPPAAPTLSKYPVWWHRRVYNRNINVPYDRRRSTAPPAFSGGFLWA